MSNIIESMEILTNEFSKLPGVGKKTAQRYAYYIINGSMKSAENLSKAIINAKNTIHYCKRCGNFTDKEFCDNCTKPNLEPIICAVKEPKDVTPLQSVADFISVFVY